MTTLIKRKQVTQKLINHLVQLTENQIISEYITASAGSGTRLTIDFQSISHQLVSELGTDLSLEQTLNSDLMGLLIGLNSHEVGQNFLKYHPDLREKEQYKYRHYLSTQEYNTLLEASSILDKVSAELFVQQPTRNSRLTDSSRLGSILVWESPQGQYLKTKHDVSSKEDQHKYDLAISEWGEILKRTAAPLINLQQGINVTRGRLRLSTVITLGAQLLEQRVTPAYATEVFAQYRAEIREHIINVLRLLANPPKLVSLTVDLVAVNEQAKKFQERLDQKDEFPDIELE